VREGEQQGDIAGALDGGPSGAKQHKVNLATALHRFELHRLEGWDHGNNTEGGNKSDISTTRRR
jgi:hypothetical protein